MSGTVENIRAKIKRRFSHKDQEVNFDDADSADEETQEIVNKEYNAAETDDKNPYGKPGSLIHRMITHGNRKTEDEIARYQAEQDAASKSRADASAAARNQPGETTV